MNGMDGERTGRERERRRAAEAAPELEAVNEGATVHSRLVGMRRATSSAARTDGEGGHGCIWLRRRMCVGCVSRAVGAGERELGQYGSEEGVSLGAYSFEYVATVLTARFQGQL